MPKFSSSRRPARRLNARAHSLWLGDASSSRLYSRPIFSGEWASELVKNSKPHNSRIRSAMTVSADKPSSTAETAAISASFSNEDIRGPHAPYRLLCGVNTWAGTNSASWLRAMLANCRNGMCAFCELSPMLRMCRDITSVNSCIAGKSGR